jgi:hypothetical protein
MGLGFRVDSLDGRRLICHGGDGVGATVFVAALPGEKVGVALWTNLGKAQAARSTIGHAALRTLAGDCIGRAGRAAEQTPISKVSGRYESTFWGYVGEVAGADGGLTLSVDGGLGISGSNVSILEPIDATRFRADGGMFDGFELEFEFAPNGEALAFHGGLYPYTFTRTGAIQPAREPAIDDSADLVGTWTGTLASPFGSLPATLVVLQERGAHIDAMNVRGERLRSFRADAGRLEGDFGVDLPNVGKFDVFLRLAASGGKLAGKAYARGAFGEVPMPVELERQ